MIGIDTARIAAEMIDADTSNIDLADQPEGDTMGEIHIPMSAEGAITLAVSMPRPYPAARSILPNFGPEPIKRILRPIGDGLHDFALEVVDDNAMIPNVRRVR